MDNDVKIALNELKKQGTNRPKRKPDVRPSFVPPFLPMTRDEVCHHLRMSKAKMYGMLDANGPRYCPDFPKPLKWGARSVMFNQNEIYEWMNSRGRALTIDDSDE